MGYIEQDAFNPVNMWTIVTSILILAVASGLAALAFKRPGGYRVMSKWLILTCVGVFLVLLGYGYGHFRAQFKTGKADANNGLPFSEHQMVVVVLCLVVFLQLLRWLPELIKREGKNEADKNKPSKGE